MLVNVVANLIAAAALYLGAVAGGYLKANPILVTASSLLIGVATIPTILFGGYRYVTSGGEETRVRGAKRWIAVALAALVLVAMVQLAIQAGPQYRASRSDAGSASGWTINWGSAPDWLAAVGTAGSLIVIVVGLLREIRRRRRDDEVAAAERRHASAKQARLVTVVAHGWTRQAVLMMLRNESQAPIFDVEPSLLVADPQTGQHTVRLPGRVHDRVAMHRVAGDGREMRVEFTVDRPLTDDPEGVTDLIFTDAEGLRWRRVNNAQPVPVPD